MMKMKRILSMVLALVMLAGMFSMNVFAADATSTVNIHIDHDGDGICEYTQTIADGEDYQSIELPTPSKDYHIWDGWYQKQSEMGMPNKKLTSLYTNKKWELYGQFIPTCTVNYNIDGSRVKQDANMLTEDLASYDLYVPAEKAGYTFAGWWEFQKDIGAESKKENAPLSFKTKYELYGTYVANTYTVFFYDTDGTTLLTSKDVEYNTTYNLPSADEVKKDGCVLVGWKYGSNTWDPGAECKYTATSDFKMTAVWGVPTTPTVPSIPSIPSTPITPAVPNNIYGLYEGAVNVACASKHHDALSYAFQLTIDDIEQIKMDGPFKAYVYLDDTDFSTFVSKYNGDTRGKHTFVTKVPVVITLELKPSFHHNFKWVVTDAAEMDVTCNCDHWCDDWCGGLWHKHTVTYNDGVKGDVIFKDITYTVKHGAKTPVPAAPVRVGYKFAGWTPAVSSTATKCVTYYATWVDAKGPALTKEHVAYLKGYGAGLVKPEGEITRAEAITMLYRLMDKASVKEYYTTYNAFSDVAKDAWYNDAVSTLANAGVLRYKTGLLNPNEAITRAEFFYMLTKFSNVEYTGKCTFVDVPSTYWAYEELTLAQYLGWIKGYGGGVLYPDDTITRAEVAASLNRVLGRTACKVKDTKNFIDNPVNAWYYDDIVEASIAH